MRVRRYYPKGVKQGTTYSDEYVMKRREEGRPIDSIDNARTEFILTPEEQVAWFEQCCHMVLTDTRWVLDHLEQLPEFKVGWESYNRKRKERRFQKVARKQ